jgi:hypothetical protein
MVLKTTFVCLNAWLLYGVAVTRACVLQDLKRMYKLFAGPGEQDIPALKECIVAMGTLFQEFIKECGKAIAQERLDRASGTHLCTWFVASASRLPSSYVLSHFPVLAL